MGFEQSEGLSADGARAVLTQLLQRAPRRPGGPLWSSAIEVLPEIEGWEGRPPVVGVAAIEQAGGPPLVLLMLREGRIDTETLAERLEWDLLITTVLTGEIRLAGRPAAGGDSISGDGIGGMTGSLGCLVENPAGDRFVLGCNHTLAGVNQGTVGQDAVLQPGAEDGGTSPKDMLGTLVSYETIKLGGYHGNVIDAAIAEPASPVDVEPGIRELGPIQGVSAPLGNGERVQKVGWCTGHTLGTVRFSFDPTVTFPGLGEALFVNQYGVIGDDDENGFAQQGDSGAAVLTEDTSEFAGMVIGVVERLDLAIISPIEPILQAFDVSPVT